MGAPEISADPFARIREEWSSSDEAHRWRLAVSPHAPVRELVDAIDRVVLELAERTAARIDVVRNEQSERGLTLVWADPDERMWIGLRQHSAPFYRTIDIDTTSETASAVLAKMLTTDVDAVMEADAAIRAAADDPAAWACTVARVAERWPELHEGALDVARRTLAARSPFHRIDGAWAAACLATSDALEALREARDAEQDPAIREGMTQLLE